MMGCRGWFKVDGEGEGEGVHGMEIYWCIIDILVSYTSVHLQKESMCMYIPQ
jgi:hypothetical protein